MKLNRLSIPALAFVLAAAGLGSFQTAALAQGPPPPPPPGFGPPQDGGGWDVPPQELQDIQRQGFHDGIEGARKDFGNHRRPDVNNREEFRHPNVPRPARRAYREGFRRGYDVGVSHLMGGPGRGPGPDRGPDRY